MTREPTLTDVWVQLAVVSGRIDTLVALAERDRDDLTEAATQQAHLEQRVTALEKGRSWVLGGAAAVSAAVGALVTYLESIR